MSCELQQLEEPEEPNTCWTHWFINTFCSLSVLFSNMFGSMGFARWRAPWSPYYVSAAGCAAWVCFASWWAWMLSFTVPEEPQHQHNPLNTAHVFSNMFGSMGFARWRAPWWPSATCLAAWVLQDEGRLEDHQQHVWQHGFCKMKGALGCVSTPIWEFCHCNSLTGKMWLSKKMQWVCFIVPGQGYC